jgi:ribosomal protein S18 acetylase RimI-like enzyme
MSSSQAILEKMTRCEEVASSGGRVLACVHPTDPGLGTLSAPEGDWQCIEAGEAWLREQGCTRVLGPMEGCSWFAYRANLGPFDRKPFLMEPQADPGCWLAFGYKACATYTSTLQSHEGALARLDKHRHRASDLGVLIRPIDQGNLSAELSACHGITHEAFSSAVGYAPISQQGFVAMYAPLLKAAPGELLLLAEDSTGKVLGYCLCFPEPEAPERKEIVVKSLAVHPEAQGMSVGSALVAEAHARALNMGFVGGGIHALMRADSPSQNITARGGSELIRRYALYEKLL